MMREIAATALLAMLCSAGIVSAGQSIQVDFSDGRVWLVVRDAPPSAILSEWGRRGGATIVNGEAVAGAPVTLELAGVPERDALAIILSEVPGYVLGARAPGAPGSAFDRIVILPKAAATLPLRPAPAAAQVDEVDRYPDLPPVIADILRSVTDAASPR